MFNKSIAYRLSIYISLAVISVFIAFIVANYLFNQKLLRENIENRAISLSSEVNSLVTREVVTTREVAENVAEQIIYYSKNGDAEMLLARVMKKYPFLNAIHVQIDSSLALPYTNYYLAAEEGDFVFEQTSQPVFYCQRDKELFEIIRDSATSGWTEPYRCGERENVVVSYYSPVMYSPAGGEPVYAGHVICELSLTELNEALNQFEIGNRGYAFIINKTGEYITHPNEDWILNQNVYSLPSKSLDRQKIDLDKILSGGQSGSAIVHPEILDFEKSWVYFSPINENRWFMIFVMPYRELFHELFRVTFRMLIFALLGIVVIFFMVAVISTKLIEPLTDVTSRLNRLSGQAGGGRAKTRNEIKLVTDSLEYLKSWFAQYRVAREKEEMKSLRRKEDLQQASEIQQSLIKTTFPAFPSRNDIDLYAIYKPARVVSGDLFDYFFIDEENLMFTIGDVSGKGIPAAIFMSVAQTIIRNNASLEEAKNIVNKANVELCTSNQHQFFVTLFLGVINVKKGELNYCNAAHNFPYILKPSGKIVELNSTHGLPLGLYPDKKYKEGRTKLEKGDTIILYTDGITEQQDDQKNQYGSNRFKENLQKLEGLPPEEIVHQIDKELELFKGNSPQNDDICLFVIKYTP